MVSLRTVCLVTLQVVFLGCENAEEKARYVKAPLETVEMTNRAVLNASVSEAKIRLVTVRDRELRSELAHDIDESYGRALAMIEQAERQEAVRIAEEARRRKNERRQAELAAVEKQRKADAAKKRTQPRVKAGVEDQTSQRREAIAAQRRRAKDATTNLEVRIRNSALGDGTKVLVLRNAKAYAVDFDLRCYTRDDKVNRTLPITVPAGGERHVGFLQGWCGNFKSGERCEAYVDGELMWKYEVP
jgi:hypothetical protein